MSNTVVNSREKTWLVWVDKELEDVFCEPLENISSLMLGSLSMSGNSYAMVFAKTKEEAKKSFTYFHDDLNMWRLPKKSIFQIKDNQLTLEKDFDFLSMLASE